MHEGEWASLSPSSNTALWTEIEAERDWKDTPNHYMVCSFNCGRSRNPIRKSSWVLLRNRPTFCGFITKYIIFACMFVISCYICTPKLGSFKQHTLMNSEFLRVKNPGVASLGNSGSDSLRGWSQDTCWGCSHLKTWLGWRIPFQVHSLGFWQEISVPHHVGLSIGQLIPWQLASPRVSDPGSMQESPRWKPQCLL